eukprot:g14150.t1
MRRNRARSGARSRGAEAWTASPSIAALVAAALLSTALLSAALLSAALLSAAPVRAGGDPPDPAAGEALAAARCAACHAIGRTGESPPWRKAS